MKYSGLAAVQSSNQQSVLQIYWQDVDGNIFEGDFSITNLTQFKKTMVVNNSSVKTGSPLSAIVWPSQSSSVSLAISCSMLSRSNGDKFARDGVALAACADNSSALTGIRLYYGG